MPASLDVQVLQTAASLENLAVSCYAETMRLAVIRNGDPHLARFLARTAAQHAAHAKAFNAAIARAGGKGQHTPDPRYAVPVRRALASLNGVASVVSLLETLEDTKAQTYTRYASLAGPGLRSMFVSVATAEAGHRACLLATLKLLSIGADRLTDGSSRLAGLPGAAGGSGCPHAFYPTTESAAVDEGAVR
jgi:Ferritin-like domain